MNKYESIRADMTAALKNGDKLRRLTLADIIATIDKTATAGKTRVDITDTFVDEVLVKYKKTVQEMIDTCPDKAEYAKLKEEYRTKLAIVMEYAPKIIDDVEEIEKTINLCGITNGISVVTQHKSLLMKVVMPFLKQNNCDMKVAQIALKNAMAKGDAIVQAQLNL